MLMPLPAMVQFLPTSPPASALRSWMLSPLTSLAMYLLLLGTMVITMTP